MDALILTIEMFTMLNGKGIAIQPLLTLMVYDLDLETCRAIATALSYDLPPQTIDSGTLTAEIVTSCSPK